jgi:hypothetical protein
MDSRGFLGNVLADQLTEDGAEDIMELVDPGFVTSSLSGVSVLAFTWTLALFSSVLLLLLLLLLLFWASYRNRPSTTRLWLVALARERRWHGPVLDPQLENRGNANPVPHSEAQRARGFSVLLVSLANGKWISTVSSAALSPPPPTSPTPLLTSALPLGFFFFGTFPCF